MPDSERSWPPVPGDFEVGKPDHCVAICTLGKKLEVPCDYAIIGTCKTENIGIERVITNTISNSFIRFIIVAGPEVPGHLTGRSLKALHQNGVDETTRRIINAEGAIPYIENLPLEGIERFRQQVQFVDMINTQDPDKIAKKAHALESEDPGEYDELPLWFDFKAKSKTAAKVELRSTIAILPEYGMNLNITTSVISKEESKSMLTRSPSTIYVEVRETDSGTVLFGKEG
jgi:tetrahydromethanopterin S-methyltransferase subunit A